MLDLMMCTKLRPRDWTIRQNLNWIPRRRNVIPPVGSSDTVSRAHRSCYKFEHLTQLPLSPRQHPLHTLFLGIPFAEPPTGNLRLQLPRLITSYNGTINATTAGAQCPQVNAAVFPVPVPEEIQQEIESLSGGLPTISGIPESEDCLNINVMTPAGIDSNAKLPVLVWIYGGAFTSGGNLKYDGIPIVDRSIALGQPIIYVALNYRLNSKYSLTTCSRRLINAIIVVVFGFLGGQEVKDAGIGNLGLHDQRTALTWVQQHISAFGGDPTKVTIWGESAGSMSVAMQMLTNDGNTEGLFRAACMNSGSPIPTGDITKLQASYDVMVSQTGCSNSADTLNCLRNSPYELLLALATNYTIAVGYTTLNNPWTPHADGVFLKNHPQLLLAEGSIANIPFIAGDTRDEGTLFSLANLNVTTDEEFEVYIQQVYYADTSLAALAPLFEAYPSDPAVGSPYGMGNASAFTPEYKRMASLQGDLFFQGPRRFLLDQRSAKQPTWSFISDRNVSAGLGAPHSSDLLNAFTGGDMADYIVRDQRQVLTFLDGDPALNIGTDKERMAGTRLLTRLSLADPI
ncbi:Lipase 4 [Grifola frondosa]|uniref:Carboxylic ester hydrolase n=1 Tax=Grifola frondosa TaxID=5627 RepID=A0A1C7LRX7_GRIFR|nr:Lipase 4 [Grifola frondosa]